MAKHNQFYWPQGTMHQTVSYIEKLKARIRIQIDLNPTFYVNWIVQTLIEYFFKSQLFYLKIAMIILLLIVKNKWAKKKISWDKSPSIPYEMP